jgi:predicted PhzF superfamily epimerase YddE/YHI9
MRHAQSIAVLEPATSRKQECNKTIYHIFKQNIPNIWYNSQLFVFLQRQNIKCLDMKQYRYVKSNAFTSGSIPEQSSPTRSLSLGNPAACIFTGQEELTPKQMQAIAAEHKGFVMEVVFCSQSDVADCKLTYYSSECEVEFCGHGTIATMYTMVKETPELIAKPVITAETNRKGIIEVFNAIKEEDAVYITAPAPIEHPMKLSIEQIENALTLPHGSIRNDRIFNSVKLKCQDGEVLFGGKATKKIEGEYFI